MWHNTVKKREMKGDSVLELLPLAGLSILLLLVVAALVRERRLRQAVQRLLQILIERWRCNEYSKTEDNTRSRDSGSSGL
jgi:hypothetical protein